MINNSKILTVVIPAYNMEKYINRSLDSILCGDLIADIEILVVNDGSKDQTLKIAREYEDKYPDIVKVVDKENGGWGSAINKAISIALGKYFKILDADDWYDKALFHGFIGELKKIDSDLLLTPYRYVYVAEGTQKDVLFKNIEYNREYAYSDLLTLDCGVDWFEMPSITYRTELLQTNKIRVSECFYSDIEYDYLPIKFVRSFIFLPYNIYRYYIGREGQSVSPEGTTKHYKDHLYITQKAIDYYLNKETSRDIIYKSFIKKIVCAKICHNYLAVMKYYINKEEAENLLINFDSYLCNKSGELYRLVENKLTILRLFYPIKIWRHFKINMYRTVLYEVLVRFFR